MSRPTSAPIPSRERAGSPTASRERGHRSPANDNPLLREAKLLRRLNLAGGALVSLALWSLAGIVAALGLGARGAAWDFLFALAGCGVTLVAIGLFERRLHG